MALRLYKHGQGKLSRGLAALGMGLFGMFGCYRLYLWLGGFEWFQQAVPGVPGSILGPDMPINIALVTALILFVGVAFGIYFVSNHAKVTDFLLETEAEMKKVSWPSASEIWGSSVVVMVVVVILGVYLLAVDYGLASLRSLLRSFFG